MADQPFRRRRFQFRLRTLFLVTTTVAVAIWSLHALWPASASPALLVLFWDAMATATVALILKAGDLVGPTDQRCSHEYNAAMSKPFQFSMRRMFVLLTTFCIEAGLWNILDKCFSERYRWGQDYVLLIFVGVGCLIGARDRQPVVGGLVGFGVVVEGKFSKTFL